MEAQLRVPGQVAMRVKRMISATAAVRCLPGANPVTAFNGVWLSAEEKDDRNLVFDLLLNSVLPPADLLIGSTTESPIVFFTNFFLGISPFSISATVVTSYFSSFLQQP